MRGSLGNRLDQISRTQGKGATRKPRLFIYWFAGFKLSCIQKRASTSHFFEQNVWPSRARLVLFKYWE